MKTHSTMLQSKILKTKKRLSENPWLLPGFLLLWMNLAAILAFCLRITTISWDYGIVTVDIPVLNVPLGDPLDRKTRVAPIKEVARTTPVIIMGKDSFFYGTVDSFSKSYANVRNKYRLQHDHGSPQMVKLVEELRNWHKEQKHTHKIDNPGFVLLFAEDFWPVAIMIQVIEILKQSGLYQKVVIGQGLL